MATADILWSLQTDADLAAGVTGPLRVLRGLRGLRVPEL